MVEKYKTVLVVGGEGDKRRYIAEGYSFTAFCKNTSYGASGEKKIARLREIG